MDLHKKKHVKLTKMTCFTQNSHKFLFLKARRKQSLKLNFAVNISMFLTDTGIFY